jgi:hypothetical protein
VDSLSPPGLPSEAVSGLERKLEALGNLRLNKDGCALVALVGVLFVDGCVVLLWVITALQDDGNELSKLA